MARALLLLALVFLHATASAETLWRGTSKSSTVTGSGDVVDPSGASLALSSAQPGEEGFSGAITSLDAAAYRGREVILSGALHVVQGQGNATLWIRADQLGERLEFKNTSDRPLRLQDGAQAREIRLYVPQAATRLRFGVTLREAGSLRAESLKLRAEAVDSNGVSAYDVLDAALSAMAGNAMNRAKVDWQAERAARLSPELKHLPPPEAYPGIRAALKKLEDHHSLLQTREQAAQYGQSAASTEAVQASASGNIGYLRLPGLMGTEAEAARSFATGICRSLEQMSGQASQGWIIDLRQDRGGNMWPMLDGLRPLLGDGDIGYFRDPQGKPRPWKPRNVIEGCKTDMTATPVAVLIGRRTASSGEAVAVAFKSRPGTRFFGGPTAGVSTANTSIPLPDGSQLLLTTAVDVDRAGQAYPDGLAPDVAVDDGQDAVEIASAWLRSLAPG